MVRYPAARIPQCLQQSSAHPLKDKLTPGLSRMLMTLLVLCERAPYQQGGMYPLEQSKCQCKHGNTAKYSVVVTY